ncbi:ATP-dependent helicase [Sulfolobales archaeon HS-7]|nr:ATP-dependent helicase [Sulfolobales archaeon HS-7]
MKEFAVNDRIAALINLRGWKGLSEFQISSFNAISAGDNVLLVAPTGFGKTEAAILPIFNTLLSQYTKPVSLLYITPLKALINDLQNRIEWWSSKLGLYVGRKHGEVPAREKLERLRKIPDIFITTPEGLEIDLDWAPKFRENLRGIKWVIIDEVHELANTKRGAQLAVLLERLKLLTGYDFQRIGLSATVRNSGEILDFLSGSSLRSKKVISSSVSKKFECNIRKIPQDNDWSRIAEYVSNLVESTTLIFTNSRFSTERLHEALEKVSKGNIYVHHSSVSRELKKDVEENLRCGKALAVICTKTLELGIHIGDIKKVILFRPPPTVASFLQRLGRSGHSMEEKAYGEIICLYDSDVLEATALLYLARTGNIEQIKIAKNPLDVAARETLGMALQYKDISADVIYTVLHNAYPFTSLSRDTFWELLEYLSKNKLLNVVNDRIKIGPFFFRQWRFGKGRTPWSHDFSEFFSFINSGETFTVRYKDTVVGDIDSVYVYRHIRVNDVIRISGKLWRVVRINPMNLTVEVVPDIGRKGEVPIWRGENIAKSPLLVHAIDKLLSNLGILKTLISDESSLNKIESVLSFYEEKGLPAPSSRVIYIEKYNNETIFSSLLSEKISNTIAYTLLSLASTTSLNSYARASIYGFAIKGLDANALIKLASKNEREIKKIVMKAVMHSSLFYATLKELERSFGKIGKLEKSDSILLREAMRQTISRYFSIRGTVKYLKEIRRGRIKLVTSNELTPLGLAVLSHSTIRPWLHDTTYAIISTLSGGAYTVKELSEILSLPQKLIENKLKRLRKSSNSSRTVSFIDIDTLETRWCLAREFHRIVDSDEYLSSFSPLDTKEPFHIMLRGDDESSFAELIVRAEDLLNSSGEVLKKIAYQEITELKVKTHSEALIPSVVPRYYFVRKEDLPHLILNLITVIQYVRY